MTPNFVCGVLHGWVDEDVEAGRDEDGGCEAEEENENQVVHQERLRRDPEVQFNSIFSICSCNQKLGYTTKLFFEKLYSTYNQSTTILAL